MTDLNAFPPETNLCLTPGVCIVVSVMEPTGGSAFDPCILLNDRANQLQGHPLSGFKQDQTYDTYDGQNQTADPDWYALTFPEPVVLNCVEMTMGLPYTDGG
jgi:hypothetical protein